MVSLRNQDVPYSMIERIYLSHFHGDHYFGMPFLVLNLLNYYLETGKSIKEIEVFGPGPLKENLTNMQKLATSDNNPSVEFISKVFRFKEVDSSTVIQLDDTKTMVFHEMAHSRLAYGFSILEHGSYRLTYLCDTKWSDSFREILMKKPKYVFCDLNSHPDDKIREHMTELDILENAIPITGKSTQYVGVHLSGVNEKDNDQLRYSRVGDEYQT
jgi:ribonuclease BN (tRNA processing enzyme)